MFCFRCDIFSCETSCQKTYHRMRNTCRTSYGTTSASYAVEGLFCTFFKFASLCVCNVLHNVQILCTGFCTGVTSDTAVDLRIQFHHDLCVRFDLLDIVSSLIGREERDACHIHTLLYLCLTGKAGFQFIIAFDSVDCCAGSAETVTAATSSFQGVSGILHSGHDSQLCRHTVFLTEKIYIYHFFHLSVPVLS